MENPQINHLHISLMLLHFPHCLLCHTLPHLYRRSIHRNLTVTPARQSSLMTVCLGLLTCSEGAREKYESRQSGKHWTLSSPIIHGSHFCDLSRVTAKLREKFCYEKSHVGKLFNTEEFYIHKLRDRKVTQA